MPYSFTIRYKNKETGEHVPHRVEFPDDEWQRLLFFADGAEKLLSCRLIQEGRLRATAQVHWSKETGKMEFKTSLPADDDIATILHKLRPFVLHDEPTSFYRVNNIMARYMADNESREMLARIKDEYSGKNARSELKIEVANEGKSQVVNCDATLAAWLNAFEYHRDQDKRAEIEALHAMLPSEMLRTIFVYMIIDKIRAIESLAMLIRKCLLLDGKPIEL